MRSRADRGRVALERALRAASVALLAWMLWTALRPRATVTGVDVAREATLPAALARWSTDSRVRSAHVLLDTAPGALRRDWLAALAHAGVAVGWSSSSAFPAVALEARPSGDPAGGARVLVAAPRNATIALSDNAGTLTDVHRGTTGAGVSFALPALDGPARAQFGVHGVAGAPRDSVLLRRVVVLGRAGWEAKFVVAALEERGWPVSARLSVAPTVDVAQGTIDLDTSRTAVVIALDSTAARDASRIMRFVRQGGGLILGADAARLAAFASIAPASQGARVRAATLAFASAAPRRALAFQALIPKRAGVIALETRDGRIVAAAQRAGVARVVQIGYDETWRWRMSGDESAPAAHRAWWSALAASVAYRGALPIAVRATDAAPLAHLVGALGAPVAVPIGSSPAERQGIRAWMAIGVMVMLLAEWASRRMRGQR